MDTRIGEILRGLLEQYGDTVGRDPQRLRAFLIDLCPTNDREISLIVRAVDGTGLYERLSGLDATELQPSTVDDLAQTLEQQLGVTSEAARWTAEVWTHALSSSSAPPALPTSHRMRAGPLFELDLAVARRQVLADLARALADCDDERTVATWWHALRLGCTPPLPVTEAVRAARLRRLASRASGHPSAGSASGDLHFPPGAQSHVLALRAERMTAARTLRRAVTRKWLAGQESSDAAGPRIEDTSTEDTQLDEQIADAARTARETGAIVPDLDWSSIMRVEDQVAGLESLQIALASNNTEDAARAWLRLRAQFPDALSPGLSRAGHAAFRRWGASLRREGNSTSRRIGELDD